MKMKQLETVFHSARLEFREPSKNFCDRQTKLRSVASRGLPASTASGRKLDAHADRRTNPHSFGVLENEIQFGVFLDDRNDPATHLLCRHGHLDELRVL